MFYHDGVVYRQVNKTFKDNYDQLQSSGLYRCLVNEGLLVKHEETEFDQVGNTDAYKIIRPETIPFVSYPYEWCFSQLKAAALATIRIQKIALDYRMSLKDASAYNIQFFNNRPVLIDTLSFERLRDGEPWVAYKQFCEHFLAPLALSAYADIRLNRLLMAFLDGIPLDLANRLLPKRTWCSFPIALHIHLHVRSQKRYANDERPFPKGTISKRSLLGLIDSLESAVRKLNWKSSGTQWDDYYAKSNYTQNALQEKKRLVGKFLQTIDYRTVWDLGANDGAFSRLAANANASVISFDADYAAGERNLKCALEHSLRVFPLVVDLLNPSPALGWRNLERQAVFQRGAPDVVMALALIHHLAIGANVPLIRLAAFFGGICPYLIIEFVPTTDSQVKRMLAGREFIFADYTKSRFEDEFSNWFEIEESVRIAESDRILYLMKNKRAFAVNETGAPGANTVIGGLHV